MLGHVTVSVPASWRFWRFQALPSIVCSLEQCSHCGGLHAAVILCAYLLGSESGWMCWTAGGTRTSYLRESRFFPSKSFLRMQ